MLRSVRGWPVLVGLLMALAAGPVAADGLENDRSDPHRASERPPSAKPPPDAVERISRDGTREVEAQVRYVRALGDAEQTYDKALRNGEDPKAARAVYLEAREAARARYRRDMGLDP